MFLFKKRMIPMSYEDSDVPTTEAVGFLALNPVMIIA